VRCPSCQVTIRFRQGRPDSEWIHCPRCGEDVPLGPPVPGGDFGPVEETRDTVADDELMDDGWTDSFQGRQPRGGDSSQLAKWLGAAAMACVLLVLLVVGATAMLARVADDAQPAVPVTEDESAPAQAEQPGVVPIPVADPSIQPAAPVAALPVAAVGDALRYRWQPGKEYAYRVKITADLGDETQDVTGQWNYRVEAHKRNAAVVADELAQGGQAVRVGGNAIHFALNYSGHFTSYRRSKPGFIGPPNFPTSASDHCRVIVDETGRVVAIEGEAESLPLVIEPMATFVLDPLPQAAQTTWQTEEQRSLARIQREGGIWGSFGPRRIAPPRIAPPRIAPPRIAPPRIGPGIGPRFGPRFHDPFGDREKVTVFSAQERRQYTVTESTPQAVTIRRQFELKTTERAAGVPSLELTGVGTIRFDRAESLPQRIEHDMLLKIEVDNVSVRIPFEVECTRLTDVELAEAKRQTQKAVEEAQQRAAEQKIKDNSPETLAGHVKTLNDLTPEGEFSKRYNALNALKQMTPADHAAARKDVIAALEPLREDANNSIRGAALKAYVHWADKDELDGLIGLTGHDDFFVRQAVIGKLGQIGGKRAAEAIAPQLAELRYRSEATKALAAIGPDAGEAIIQQADADDYQTRSAVYEVLGKIGSEKARELLTKRADEDPHFAAKLAAKRALDSFGM
jgi:HEAT repeat protein